MDSSKGENDMTDQVLFDECMIGIADEACMFYGHGVDYDYWVYIFTTI